MKYGSFLVALAFCGGALITMLMEHAPSSRVLAAGQAQNEQRETEIVPLKPPPPPPGAKPGTELVPIKTGTLTGLGAVEWYVYGLQLNVKDLQGQIKTLQEQLQQQAAADKASIQTLQAALQSLQAQYANHSHMVKFMVAGEPCGYNNSFNLTPTTGPPSVNVDIIVPKPCPNHPEWGGRHPGIPVNLAVSTPVPGPQAGQQQ